MENLDPKFDIIPLRDKVVIENEGIGAKVGGLGGILEATVADAINVDGDFKNDVIGTVGGRVADIIAAAIDSAGHFADDAISTADGTILGEFTFGNSGAIQIGTYESGVTGDIRISPTGILGRDKTGATTFSINGTTGVAVLNGLVVGTNVDIGTAVDSIGVTTIIDNTVTTGYVNALSITALGTVTAGAFVLDSSGYIRGGQTAYGTGDGFWFGYDVSKYKFSLGTSTQYIKFDGTNAEIKGILNLIGTLQLKAFTVATLPVGNSGAKFPTATGTYFDEWTDPANAYTEDGNYTTETSTDAYQDYSGFGFALPFVTIQGIKIEIKGHFTGVTGTPQLYVGMTKDGDWITGEKNQALNLTTDTVLTFGGASDLWGETGWYNTDFNYDNLYVRFKIEGGGGGVTAYVDYVKVTVYYTDPQNPISAGSVAYVSDGRKTGEGAGTGTGVLAYYDETGTWIGIDTITLAA